MFLPESSGGKHMTEVAYAIEMIQICKQYGKVRANHNVNLRVPKGEIHAIVGENGAGKTTLMNILYGLVQPNSGEIKIDGKTVHIKDSKGAIALGIGMVHQHFKLVADFTVAENICLGHEPRRKNGLVDHKKMQEYAKDISNQYGLKVNPNEKTGDLSVGLLQRVEILKSLSRGAEILILDEPTAVLTPLECKELFRVLKNMKKQGKTMIIITHKLKEVIEISDHITVLSKGETKGSVETKNTTVEELTSKMIGKNTEFHLLERQQIKESTPKLLIDKMRVKDNMGVERLKGISLSVKRGEILTVAGVEGNGQTELVEALLGFKKIEAGSIQVESTDITHRSIKERRKYCSYIPEDRCRTGLDLGASVHDNIIAGLFTDPSYKKRGFINYQATKNKVKELIQEYVIKAASQQIEVSSLSGGNQQKIVVARELMYENDVIIVAQPSRGVDIGATRFIHQQLLKKRNEGKAILLISTDLDEVFALSDRIAVLFDGEITAFLHPDEVTAEEVGLYMTGSKKQTISEMGVEESEA